MVVEDAIIVSEDMAQDDIALTEPSPVDIESDIAVPSEVSPAILPSHTETYPVEALAQLVPISEDGVSSEMETPLAVEPEALVQELEPLAPPELVGGEPSEELSSSVHVGAELEAAPVERDIKPEAADIEIATEQPSNELPTAPSEELDVTLDTTSQDLSVPIPAVEQPWAAVSEEVDYVERFAPESDYPVQSASSAAVEAATAALRVFKRQPLDNQLASTVLLSRMLYVLQGALAYYAPSVCKSFSTWKSYNSSAVVAENKKLEQRVQKLKGLLAKTYQAKQRTQEDSEVSAKRSREMLRSKAKDELERSYLLQAMRDQAAEAERQRAFHYDMEILIQRAATELVTQPTTPQLPRYNKSQYDELEMEFSALQSDVADKEEANEALQQRLDETSLRLEELSQLLSSMEASRAADAKELSRLRGDLKEESTSRADAEREV